MEDSNRRNVFSEEQLVFVRRNIWKSQIKTFVKELRYTNSYDSLDTQPKFVSPLSCSLCLNHGELKFSTEGFELIDQLQLYVILRK
jgi:hypothetical protein